MWDRDDPYEFGHPMHYDKQGKPIGLRTWGTLFEDLSYKVLKQTHTWNGYFISTIWLGIDHGFHFGPDDEAHQPIIFETMVFSSYRGRRWLLEWFRDLWWAWAHKAGWREDEPVFARVKLSFRGRRVFQRAYRVPRWAQRAIWKVLGALPRPGEDLDADRYATEAEALVGHEHFVRKWRTPRVLRWLQAGATHLQERIRVKERTPDARR